MRRALGVLTLLCVGLIGLAVSRPILSPSKPSPSGQPLPLSLASVTPETVAAGMLIVAHRGDLDRFPENTADAVWAAAELGVDGIEMDVHRSADGTWFVIHDPTLDRTTDGTGAIARLHDAEIEAATIDGGLGYRPDVDVALHVPRLATVLHGLRGFSGRIYLDLKHATGGDATEVIRLASAWQLAVLCRTEQEARAIHVADSRIETIVRWTGQPGTQADGWLMEAAMQATAQAVAASEGPVTTYVNERYVARSEIPFLERAWRLGVSAFITKYPAAALAARDRLARQGSPRDRLGSAE